MLTTLKIILLIVGLPALFFTFVGNLQSLAFAVPCLAGAIVIDRYQAKLKKQGMVNSRTPHLIENVLVLIFGLAILLITIFLGKLGNIDTTGNASPGVTAAAFIISLLFIIGGFTFVNRRRN